MPARSAKWGAAEASAEAMMDGFCLWGDGQSWENKVAPAVGTRALWIEPLSASVK